MLLPRATEGGGAEGGVVLGPEPALFVSSTMPASDPNSPADSVGTMTNF
jgi:hypothetical protein